MRLTEGVEDKLCDSKIKNHINAKKGENDNADGTDRNKKTNTPTEENSRNDIIATTDQDGSGSKEKDDILPLYVGGGVSVLILFAGCIICYLIVKYILMVNCQTG